MAPASSGPMSRCGVVCTTDCHAFGIECEGCVILQGRVSWAEFYGRDDCPIHACAVEKGFEHCGQCGKAPCRLWYATRNPDATDAEFAADLASRLNNLASHKPHPHE